MRCFIAVELDPSLAGTVIKLQEHLRGRGIKLVDKENFHFTLKFLGEVDEATIKRVKEKLKHLASSTQPFTITISGIGVFHSMDYIKVIWVGVKEREFSDMHIAVDSALSPMFPIEKPVPHLTLARVREKPGKELLDFIANNKNVIIGRMLVNKIHLKKSTITQKGPVYEDLDVFRLGSE